MADYCFTICVIHFIVVSCVQNDFPVNGAWWTAMVAGFLLCWFLSERLRYAIVRPQIIYWFSYTLATMTYQSALGNNTINKQQTSDREVELSDLELEEPTHNPTAPDGKKKKKRSKSSIPTYNEDATPNQVEEGTSDPSVKDAEEVTPRRRRHKKPKQDEEEQKPQEKAEVTVAPAEVHEHKKSKKRSKRHNAEKDGEESANSIP